MGIVSGLAWPLGCGPSFSGCGQPSSLKPVPLVPCSLSVEGVSCQHETEFYELSWLNTLIHKVLGKTCQGQGLCLRGRGAPGGISPIYYQDGGLGELQRSWTSKVTWFIPISSQGADIWDWS